MNVKFTDGLIPAIVRDARTGEVLTLAYMSEESLRRTEETGETWFWSRSRKELWHKGATSGNTQKVVDITPDCDRDALVVSVIPAGPACHTGARSCFDGVPPRTLDKLYATLQSRFAERPEGSYSASLFNAGRAKILKKVNEEATEVVIAAAHESRERLVSEIADLLYHLEALMVNEGVTLADVEAELARRER
ncbi:MAG TPA: bifunctional phosphoribosyl-AMP cyclohydrolase/phosphoribosyl-ATP diphosphatase HisIE [Thermoanaerobaculia bacterium]|nr:bifunctional phosphoribosyl-AMP cyclohydrolase/phosphoribosyl-ATP diphosphatase HisIE [Thermoanaerobaculia bacterium]